MGKKSKKNYPDRHNEKIKTDLIAADELNESEADAGTKDIDAAEPDQKDIGGKEPDIGKAAEDEQVSGTSADEDLYADEVYRDLDTSDDDMVFLDISGSEVKIASSGSPEKEHSKISISIDTEAALAWLLTVLCSVVFISLTFNKNVWLDEAFTASLVNTDMAGVIERSMADTLPPLYNIILRLTTYVFGYTVPVMKLTGTVPMILTMILGATVVRKRFGAYTSYIFILAVTVMPEMLFYGVEIRMYSLGFLFATASGIFAFEVISKPSKKNWILFTLFSVLAGYSHHFAFVTAGFIYLFLLIYTLTEQKKFNSERDRSLHPVILSSFVKCLLATFVLYLPCMLVTLKQLKSVSGYFSMPDVTLPVFIKYCRYPFTVGFTPLSILLLTVTLILLILLLLRMAGVGHKHDEGDTRPGSTVLNAYSLYCFFIFYGVLLFGTAVSSIMTANIFVDRYLFFSLGLIWLFFAIEAGTLSTLKKPFIYCFILFELVIGIYSYTRAFTSEYAPGANEMIGWLKENVSDGDSLYTLENYEELAWCLPFYDNSLTNYETLDEAVSAAGRGNVWVAVMNGYEDESMSELPSGNRGYNSYVTEMETEGYSMEYMGVFRFDRYIFRMYKLAALPRT